MRKRSVLLLSMLMLACTSGTSTDTSSPHALSKEQRKLVRDAGRELDAIATDLEDFGSVSVSASAVLRKPQGFFGFRLNLTPEEIFKRERVEASSRVSDFQSIDVRLALALKYLKESNEETDPAKAEAKRGAAEAELASALTDDAGAKEGEAEKSAAPPSSTGDANEEAAKEKLDLPTNEAKGALPKEFTAALSAREGPMSLSLRQLIQITFNDHITLKLFEWLSDPDPYVLGENKTLFAAVLNVSVRPGKRTYEGYVGEVDVRVGYARQKNGLVEFADDERHPLSFAVFPGLDTQVIDERTSVRRQLAVALLLAAQAPKVDGNLGVDFVRRLEQDVATVTGRNTVVGYNMAGRHFGWRFQPRLEAQADPSSIRTKPALQLQAQTFPALVLILADNDDLSSEVLDAAEIQSRLAALENDVKAARLSATLLTETTGLALAHVFTRIEALTKEIEQLKSKEAAEPEEMAASIKKWSREIGTLRTILSSGSLPAPSTPHARSDHFVFYQSMRWLRAPTPGIDLGSWLLRPFRRASYNARHPRLPETKQIDWAVRIASVRQIVKEIEGRPKSGSSAPGNVYSATGSTPSRDTTGVGSHEVARSLSKRLLMLEAASVGTDVFAAIPKPRPAPAADDAGATYHGWQNRQTSIGIRGRYFKGQVLGAVVGTRLCSVSVVSDSAVVVACDPWAAAKHPALQPASQPGGFPIHLVTTRGRVPAGYVIFDLTADEQEIKPFAKMLPIDKGTSKSLAFQIDGKLLPKWRDSFELWLRSTTDATAVPKLVPAKVTIDLSFKASVEFDAGKSFEKLDRLEVDLRLKPNPDAPAVSVTVRDAGSGGTSLPDVLYYPDDAARGLTLDDVTIEFDNNGKVKPKTAAVAVKYADKYGGLAQLKSVFPRLGQDLTQKQAKLSIADNIAVDLVETSQALTVEVAQFEAQANALASAGDSKKFQKLQVQFGGLKFAVTGTLTVTRDK